MRSDPSYKADGKHIDFLFPYAYNILGSAEDAKDAVQDVLIKHLSGSEEHITDEKNYLIRSVINLAVNMKSRQKKPCTAESYGCPNL